MEKVFNKDNYPVAEICLSAVSKMKPCLDCPSEELVKILYESHCPPEVVSFLLCGEKYLNLMDEFKPTSEIADFMIPMVCDEEINIQDYDVAWEYIFKNINLVDKDDPCLLAGLQTILCFCLTAIAKPINGDSKDDFYKSLEYRFSYTSILYDYLEYVTEIAATMFRVDLNRLGFLFNFKDLMK